MAYALLLQNRNEEEREQFKALLRGEAEPGVQVESFDELGELVKRTIGSAATPEADDRGLLSEMDRLMAMRKGMGLPDVRPSSGTDLPRA